MNWTQLIAALLAKIEAVLIQLEECYGRKQDALRSASTPEIERLVLRETELGRQLQEYHNERSQILQRAGLVGIQVETLDELLQHQGHGPDHSVRSQIERVEGRMAELRHRGWVQWIISNCNYRHQTEMVELMASAGRSRLTYHDRDQAEWSAVETGGGNLLDASA